MQVILTAEQMRAAERAAMDAGGVTGLELMARAGAAVVAAILAEWPDLATAPGRARIWCGPGNNGGDGFVVARLFRERGWQLDVRLSGDPDRLPPDARASHDAWCALGPVTPLTAPAAPVDLEVDALFGTGLARPVEDPWLWEILRGFGEATDTRALGGRAARTVAIDIPSGLHADSGRILGNLPEHGCRAPRVMLTVTFHRPKLGHYLGEGPDLCGRLVVRDIGLDAVPAAAPGYVRLVGPPSAAAVDKAGGHKFSHGHALVLAGGAGRTGAARLAARAALRIGAGLVTLGVPEMAQAEVAAQITAAMMTRIDDAAGLGAVLQDPRLSSLCLGPGLGQARARALLPVALADGRACVVDADALSAFRDDPDTLFGMLHRRCILTPHQGEFARLFPDLAQDTDCSRTVAARRAAERAGCTVLLKGPDTVIADPDGGVLLHGACYDRAAPWLATAGAGDVLAGMIAGLLARDTGAEETVSRLAARAVWLHVDCARAFGPGLIAEDLPGMLPQVLAALTGGQGQGGIMRA